MNERIRELIKQATSYTWNGNGVTEELDEEKFVESIVKECVSICTQGNIEKPLGLMYANQIKKHFGVEE